MRMIRPLLAFLVLLAALTDLGRPAAAQEFIARQIENLVSTDSLKVKIDGLSGALTGNLRIASVTVSDPQGPFLTARDLAMDWSPLGIVRSDIDVRSLTAGRITFERLPQLPPSPAAPSSGGGLPNLTANVQRIAISEFVLGEAVAGTPARLSLDARLVLAADPTKLETSLNIERLDRPGRIAANVVYAPGDNRLDVTVEAGEPAGGLVATLLKLPGAPPVQLTVNGSGPLSDFAADGALDVDGRQAAMLTARIADAADGRRVTASLNVAAERFAPEAYQAYVRGGARLDAAVLLRTDGVIGIEEARLSSDAVRLTASGTLDRAGPLTALDVALASPDGGPIPLRFGEGAGRTVVDVAQLRGTLAGALAAADIDLSASLPQAGYGPYAARDLTLKLGSTGFDIANVSGPLAIEADAGSVAMPEGIGQRFTQGRVRITADGSLAPDSLTLTRSRITTATANAAIGGTAALNFSTFDLTLSSDFETLALSAAAVPLTGDRLAVSGRVRRDAGGALAAEGLAVRGTGLTIAGSARLADETVEADVKGTLDVPPQESASVSGKADFSLRANGPTAQPNVDIALNSLGLRVNGRELADVKVEARGAFAGATPSGSVNLSGTLDGTPLTGTAQLATLPSGERRISDLAVRQGPNSVAGDLTLTQAGVPVGTLDVAVSDIGPLAALALQKIGGDLNGRIDLSVDDRDFPVAAVDLTSKSLTAAGNTLTDAALALSVEDYLGKPRPSGTIRAGGIEAGGIKVEGLSIDLSQAGAGTRLDARARANGIPVELGGVATITPAETAIALEKLTAAIPDAAVALDQASRITIANGVTTLSPTVVRTGAGSLRLAGTAGQTLDLTAELDRLPAALANAAAAGLDASGSLSGIARVTGPANAPTAVFDISGTGITAREVADAGVPPIELRVRGSYEKALLTLAQARATMGAAFVEASGTAGETLDLQARLQDVPVALADGFVPGLGAQGTISGTASANGPIGNPRATFDVAVTAFTLAQTRDAGVEALTIRANGDYANRDLRLDANLSGAGGLAFSAGGTIGLAGTPQFDLRASGTAPLSLANRILAEGGRAAQGNVRIDVSVRGTAAAPNVGGTISTAGATFTDTGANVALRNIATTITLSGQTATISSFSAALAAGGTLAAAGTVGLTNGFPADIRIRGNNARYADGELVAATLNAALTMTGQLTRTPLLAGTIDLQRMDILVPSSFPSSLARIDVTHRNAPPRVLKQQRQLFPPTKGGGGGGGIDLDIAFNAPSRIFVRGRGLDIQLGGSLRIGGSAAAPSITGGFELQRGRLVVLDKRLDFQSGRMAFTGDLIPLLDFVATSASGDVTVQVAVTGPANDPSFSFSSSPALPQDEVLARLIFNQGTTNLSPLQIAQLAEASAQLAGVGGSTGLLENLRSQLGVDDIDLRTTADGQTAVGVGKYINDRTYFGVDSTGRASINLDIGKGVKARGAVTAQGGGEVGIFYENEF